MAVSVNPFAYGRHLGLADLVDRKTEMEAIRTAIRNRDKLFLIGPRRFGKTSLLAAVRDDLDPADFAVVHINAEAFTSLQAFAEELASATARAFRTPAERASQWLQDRLARLRPRLVLGPEGVSIGFGLGERSDRIEDVAAVLDAIEALAESHDRTFALIIDEVQELVLPEGLAAEKVLRSAVQRHRHVGYVFAGSATRLLMAMTSEANRPFYRLGQKLFLGPVPRADFTAFIGEQFTRSGFGITDEAISRILDHAADVPFNVQRLAHEVWEMTRTGALPLGQAIEPAGIDAALTRIVEMESPANSAIWRSMTSVQKTAIVALIENDGRKLQSRQVAAAHAIAPSTMRDTLGALEQRQVIRQDLDDPELRYLLVDPFFSAWLRREQHARGIQSD